MNLADLRNLSASFPATVNCGAGTAVSISALGGALANTNDLWIGRGGASQNYKGLLDDIRIYRRALLTDAPSEIGSLCNPTAKAR